MCVYWLVASVGSFKKSPHPWLPWTFSLSPVKKKKKDGLPGRRTSCPPICCVCTWVLNLEKRRSNPKSSLPATLRDFLEREVHFLRCKSLRSTQTLLHPPPFWLWIWLVFRRGGQRERFHAFAMCEWTGQHQNALLSCGCWSYLKKKKSKKRRRRRGWTATLGKSGKA